MRHLVLAFLMAAAPQDPTDERIGEWIEKLKELPPEPTREHWVGRTAMCELLVNGARAFPKLKHAFLTSDHWAVKVSAGALLVGLYRGTDRETSARVKSLLDDDHIVVRVFAAGVSNHSHSDEGPKARAILARPAEAAVQEKLRFQFMMGTDWLSDSDNLRRVERTLAFLESGSPLKDPPEWKNAADSRVNPDVTRVRSAGMRALKDPFQVGSNLVTDALCSRRGHDSIELALGAIESDKGADPGRLGLKLRLARPILNHRDKACRNTLTDDPGRCKVLPDAMPRLLKVGALWIDKSADPWVLHNAVALLASLAGCGHEPAKDLMKKLAVEHVHEEVRSMLEGRIRSLENRR